MRRTLVLAILLAGCGGAAATSARQEAQPAAAAQETPTAPLELNVPVRVPRNAGITPLPPDCDPNAEDRCNAIDDNCNGVIDEGCGYGSGSIQITLAWTTPADLDLYVTDPAGFVLSYQSPSSPSGGNLDRHSRGACDNRRTTAGTVENVYWTTPRPPSGRYQVEVHYWGECGSASLTQATLSISAGGHILGSYGLRIRPQQRQPVATFEIP